MRRTRETTVMAEKAPLLYYGGNLNVLRQCRSWVMTLAGLVLAGLVLTGCASSGPSGFWVNSTPSRGTVDVVDLDAGNGTIIACGGSFPGEPLPGATLPVHSMTVKGLALSTYSVRHYWGTKKKAKTQAPPNAGTGLRLVTPTGETVDFLPSAPSIAHRLYKGYCT